MVGRQQRADDKQRYPQGQIDGGHPLGPVARSAFDRTPTNPRGLSASGWPADYMTMLAIWLPRRGRERRKRSGDRTAGQGPVKAFDRSASALVKAGFHAGSVTSAHSMGRQCGSSPCRARPCQWSRSLGFAAGREANVVHRLRCSLACPTGSLKGHAPYQYTCVEF